MKSDNLATANLKLANEWHIERNAPFLWQDFSPSSNKKVWWICPKGHEWQAVIANRVKGSNCPYCQGRYAIKGENDLQTVNPCLAKEWNYKKNNGLTPMDVLPNSEKKVWWKCKNGHEWKADVGHRNRGSGCPYCSGRYAIQGENDLLTLNPTLAKDWNHEKNGDLKPENFTTNSGQKIWWKCKNGHEWQALISSRNRGNACPYCSGKRTLKGYNDLQTINPDLAKEWNYSKNGDLKPENIAANSNKEVWWKCKNGHEWQAVIGHRNRGSGCPYCSGRYAIQGENDLLTLNPTLAKEWNREKNGTLEPTMVTIGSSKKVWWMCSKGHEWQATIAHRSNNQRCPTCNLEHKTSFPEYAVEFYLKKCALDVIHSYRELGYELDIYIPSKKIAIEYDGGFWHKNRRKKDLEKNANCKNDGISLYRIREKLPSLNDSSIDYTIEESQNDLSDVLRKILSEITETDVDIDLKRDAIEIENLRKYAEKETSLLFCNPALAKEWNYEMNGNLKPEHFLSNSNKNVWWKCKRGHEWQATINNRNNNRRGCPYCTNQKILKGFNDLQTINPDLAKEWNHEKNNGLTPFSVSPNSHKEAWWRCEKGHEWQAIIANRNKGIGCPFCSRKKALKGYNDLQTINPNLAKEWNYSKNDDLNPENIAANSNKKAWWKCSKGHEWEARIASRNKGANCPYCASQKIMKGFNDLQSINPLLAKEWHYEKNDGLTPLDVSPNSHKKVWWKCSNGHEWQSVIKNRNKGKNCPYCSGRRKQ